MELLGRDRNRKLVLLCVWPELFYLQDGELRCVSMHLSTNISSCCKVVNELPVSDGVSLPKQLDFSFETDELARGSRSAWDPVEQGQ